jgi:hypothetical protein
VNAYAWRSADCSKLYVDLVNANVDVANDAVVPVTQAFSFDIILPAGVENVKATLISPDEDDIFLNTVLDNGRVTVTVPSLHILSIIILEHMEPAFENPRLYDGDRPLAALEEGSYTLKVKADVKSVGVYKPDATVIVALNKNGRIAGVGMVRLSNFPENNIIEVCLDVNILPGELENCVLEGFIWDLGSLIPLAHKSELTKGAL